MGFQDFLIKKIARRDLVFRYSSKEVARRDLIFLVRLLPYPKFRKVTADTSNFY